MPSEGLGITLPVHAALPWAQGGAGASVALKGLSVGCSTERATAGRKRAPVRLAAMLVDAAGQPLDVAPVLSPEFYVSC